MSHCSRGKPTRSRRKTNVIRGASRGQRRVRLRVFDQAVRWGAATRNPVTLVDPPRVTRHEFHALTPEEARSLLSGLRGDRLSALYVLALTTGMRQGELLALRWADLDLPGRRLAVRGSLHRDPGGGWTIREPKTERSRRQVLLPPMAVKALQAHGIRQRGCRRVRCGRRTVSSFRTTSGDR